MRRKLALIPFILLLFSSSFSQAGQVVKVKGKKVYVSFNKNEIGSFGEDDLFFLVDPQGKKRAIVHLRKVRDTKAIGVLVKGRTKPQVKYTTLFKGIGPKTQAKQRKQQEELEFSTSNTIVTERSYWGFVAGYGFLSQDVDQGTSTSEQTGSSLLFKGLYDYPLTETLILRSLLGVEMFSTSGDGIPEGGSTPANLGTDITYGTADLLIKWNALHMGRSPVYLFGGMGLFHPFSKSSDVIKESSLDTEIIGEVGFGVDLHMGTYKIPLALSYYVVPSSDTVQTQLFSLQIGWIWP